MSISLRPTTPADVPAVLAIEAEADVSPWITPWPAERHLEAISRQDEAHLIVLDAGRPAGFVILAGIASAEGLIELRRIAVSRRGVGIGRAAFDQALAFAFTSCSAARVWLDVLPANVRARRVYEDAGFTADDRLPDEVHPSPDRSPRLLVMSIRQVDWEAPSVSDSDHVQR
jgi:RimJ/RimL family protein N-acetyltransferase